MAENIFDQASVFLPKYLTPSQKKDLFEELLAFPNVTSFYLGRGQPQPHIELLQGDGWQGFVVVNFQTQKNKVVSGVILSNSCDINPGNPRALSPNILFSPLVSLESYERLLTSAGQSANQITGTLGSIRKQLVTSIFYLPPGSSGPPESLILLDNVHVHPLSDFMGRSRTVLFRLSQSAFYIFLLKLSIHFCRAQEGIARA